MNPGPPGGTPMVGAIPGGTMPAMLGPAVIIRGMSATHVHMHTRTHTHHSAFIIILGGNDFPFQIPSHLSRFIRLAYNSVHKSIFSENEKRLPLYVFHLH